jgi:two-component system, cell cycle sensor histidine kinase and response regulator CckA
MISETFPRTVQITLDLDPAIPLISVDAGQLHQALLNLCVNARDAMPGGGRLTIGARLVSQESIHSLFPEAESRDYVCITIADTGTGMDGMTRRRIFEPFFTTKEKGKGTGLGLAVVYGVINSHGGLIDVDSEIGRGTKFRLYFPIVSAPSESVPAENPMETPGGTETLLIVEDEPAILMALDMQLSSVGYRVFTAANGLEAIEVCKRVGQSLDGVIMDLGMPKMSAVDLMKALRDLAPHTPVIAMTGYVDAESHANVVAAGVKRIIQKPFDFVELQRCLRDVIDAGAHSGFPSIAKRD